MTIFKAYKRHEGIKWCLYSKCEDGKTIWAITPDSTEEWAQGLEYRFITKGEALVVKERLEKEYLA
jgi:hypothetical protein